MFKKQAGAAVHGAVELMIEDFRRRLSDRGMTLAVTDAARELVAREGFDPVYGARPLRRFLQRELETRIGRALVGGEIPNGAAIRVELEDGELIVRHEDPGQEAVQTETESVGN